MSGGGGEAEEGKQMNSSSNSKMTLEDIQRKVKESSATIINDFQHKYSSQLPVAVSTFKSYENAFFTYLKEGLISVKEHPTAAIGVGVSAALILFRGPRRFLFRQTLGRLQSEEALFLKAEKNVKDFSLSVDLVKKESKKLFERAALAEKDMKLGYNNLMDAGSKIQNLSSSVYKAENQAADLMEGLREIPGREALKLRAEVASMVSLLKKERSGLDKRIMKISEQGIPV